MCLSRPTYDLNTRAILKTKCKQGLGCKRETHTGMTQNHVYMQIDRSLSLFLYFVTRISFCSARLLIYSTPNAVLSPEGPVKINQ